MNRPFYDPIYDAFMNAGGKSEAPLPDPAELLLQFADKHLPDASKEVADLTGDEKMALCIKAGVDLTFAEDGKVRSRHPCGFYKIEGQFRVMVDARSYGSTIHFKVPHPL